MRVLNSEGLKMDLFEGFNQHLKLEPFKKNTYSPIVLAYMGDSIYDLIIRSMVVNKGAKAVGKIHKEVSSYVNAKAQADIYYKIEPILTEEERAVFRRGRNAKSNSTPKNADLKTYKHATGFEAILGYLYMSGNLDRIMELVALGLEEDAPDK